MKLIVAMLLAGVAGTVTASGLDPHQYAQRFILHDTSSPYWPDVRRCLAAWHHHPFRDLHKIRFRLLHPKVRVFGLGDNIADFTRTNYPQIIFIKAAVNVMSKTTYQLKNPNGWYCFEAKVNVLGKSIIRAACTAHIATTKGNVVVLGKDRTTKGTTVLGKSLVYRDCGHRH